MLLFDCEGKQNWKQTMHVGTCISISDESDRINYFHFC